MLFSENVNVGLKTQICDDTKMEAMDSLDRYLGIPMIQGRINKFYFSKLLGKLDTNLAGWKTLVLSFMGRINFAKSILTMLPNHLIQLVYLPKSVCDEFNKRV